MAAEARRNLVPIAEGNPTDVDNQMVVTPDEEDVPGDLHRALRPGPRDVRAEVVVESQEEFDQWIAEQKAAQAETAADPRRARDRFEVLPAALKPRNATKRCSASCSAAPSAYGLVVACARSRGSRSSDRANGLPHVIVPAITAPFGFLIGLGCFDLLVPLGRRRADRARGPLAARRPSWRATTSAGRSG